VAESDKQASPNVTMPNFVVLSLVGVPKIGCTGMSRGRSMSKGVSCVHG